MLSARAAIAVLLFVLIVVLASFAGAERWDSAITLWLQRAAPAPDMPAATFVFLGDAEVMITAAVLAGLTLLFRDRPRGIAALQLAAGLAAVSVLALVLKAVIPLPGPLPPLQRHIGRLGIPALTHFSLPSGHTMRTTFVAGMVLRRYPVLAGAAVFCMMVALVYLGDHWTTDVLAGLCLGWACVEVARGFTAGRSRAQAVSGDLGKP